MICSACHLTRDASDLIAFWPVGRPEARRFVCRPTCPSGRTAGPCFGVVVGPSIVHAITLAVPLERIGPRSSGTPILPMTPAWASLMAEAGVRNDAPPRKYQGRAA